MVAPPTSTTSRSAPSTSAVTSTPRSTASGVGARTISRNAALVESPLPPMTWSRKVARIAARAPPGLMTPISGTTLSATRTASPASPRRTAASSRASTLPATTTGRPKAASASRDALCSNTSELPPSVPPTRRIRSGWARPTARSSLASSLPDATWTTLAPALSPTRYPASAVTCRSYPTTASRSPPPALEQASRNASSLAPSRSASRRQPSRTSVPRVVGVSAVPRTAPSVSSRTALVYVEPTSRHSRSDAVIPAGRESVCVGRTPRSRRPAPRRRR